MTKVREALIREERGAGRCKIKRDTGSKKFRRSGVADRRFLKWEGREFCVVDMEAGK